MVVFQCFCQSYRRFPFISVSINATFPYKCVSGEIHNSFLLVVQFFLLCGLHIPPTLCFSQKQQGRFCEKSVFQYFYLQDAGCV